MNEWICRAVYLCWEFVPRKENNVLCKGGCGKLTKIELVRLLCQGQAKCRLRTASSSTNNYYCLKEEWGNGKISIFQRICNTMSFFCAMPESLSGHPLQKSILSGFKLYMGPLAQLCSDVK